MVWELPSNPVHPVKMQKILFCVPNCAPLRCTKKVWLKCATQTECRRNADSITKKEKETADRSVNVTARRERPDIIKSAEGEKKIRSTRMQSNQARGKQAPRNALMGKRSPPRGFPLLFEAKRLARGQKTSSRSPSNEERDSSSAQSNVASVTVHSGSLAASRREY